MSAGSKSFSDFFFCETFLAEFVFHRFCSCRWAIFGALSEGVQQKCEAHTLCMDIQGGIIMQF